MSSSPSRSASAPEAAVGPPARPLRRDAELNRTRILTAARELFVERGVDVGVEEIARQAGVGMGTLYRRFPNKDALIEAVLHPIADGIRELAAQVAAVEPPEHALRCFLTRILLADPFHRLFLSPRTWRSPGARALGAEVLPLIVTMLEAAKRAGAVREDVVAADVLVMVWSVRTVTELTDQAAPESWRRALEIMLAGIRPDDRNTRLPAPSASFTTLGGTLPGGAVGVRGEDVG
ncbi:TetR/AcrR family transcriptional regulator [Frankia sp. AgKG'84/4]|uniref:TetR/AcrR family transcriptional regulator n=1 Tax=Frankia sp. AgKG'84/4 TaxID=573490 RepID=UPI00200F45FC|nr:TetR/AcrR family transcriptional regulator [Frankia sp. AgKG'84/4]MCL9796350.1 TetR/AcrR family transcriptional regulator [Frankia sp. AgKG'84/4]